MEKLLGQKRILVTGASRGLGLAIAKALVTDGAQTVLVSRDEKRLGVVAGELRTLGGICTHIAADIREPESTNAIVDHVMNEFGGIDGLVNNAGVFVWKSALDLTREDFNDTIATNLSAPFFLSQAVARIMIQQGEGGSILNIASIHGRVPDANVVAHCASKFGLLGLTRSLAEAWREHDIRVNAICPGAIQPDSDQRRAESPREKVTQLDVATLAVFLVSDLACSITGATIDTPGSTRTVIKT